jgi:hypothetical protein
MTRSRLIVRWLGSVTAVAVGLAWLHLLGRGDLGGPPHSLDGLAPWLEQRDAALVTFALLRVVALGFGWYVLTVTTIAGAARLLHLPRLSSLVERLTLPFARGMVGGMALLGVTAAPPPTTQPPPDSMIEIEEHATLHLLPDTSSTVAPGPAPTSTVASTPPPAPTAAPAPDTVAASATDAWVVQPGESFWSIAAEHLADVNGRPVSDQEVDAYWRQLIDVNRSRLVNPTDIDLLFTGQALALPAAG